MGKQTLEKPAWYLEAMNGLENASKEDFEIHLDEINKKQAECAARGHPGEERLMGEQGIRMSCYCVMCGSLYDRPYTPKERKEWEKLIHTPFNI